MNFQAFALGPEDGFVEFSPKGGHDAGSGPFGHFAAAPADQQQTVVRMIVVVAADIGVEALHLVDETLLGEKSQGPIDGCGFGQGSIGPQSVEQVVGFDGAVIRPDQFQNTAAQWCQAYSPLPAATFGAGQGVLNATPVVV